MFRSTILLFCFYVITFDAFPQTFSRVISWPVDSLTKMNLNLNRIQDQLVKPYLWFENNVHYPNMENMLPYFADISPINNSVSDISQLDFKILRRIYTPLNNDELSVIQKLASDEISNQEEFFNVFKSRGQSYLQFGLPAISINPSTQRVEKLVSFEINIIQRKDTPIRPIVRNYSSQSVLATGEWRMISIKQTGIHRISYAQLQSMGLSNLENVSLWGNGGRQLPFWNNQPSPTDLQQIPLWIDKGSDNAFNPGDYIYFFVQGPTVWDFDSNEGFFMHRKHDYTDAINYFITTSRPNPLRVSSLSSPSASANQSTSSYDALMYIENDDVNLIKSGRQWFGDSFDVYATRNYTTGLSNPVANGTAKVRVRVAARSSVGSTFSLRANGTSAGNISIASVNTASQYTNYAAAGERTFTLPYTQGELTLELSYGKPTPAAKGWLDYITVNARQGLKMHNDQLIFRDSHTVLDGAITEFNIGDIPAGLRIWDISDIFNPANLEFTTQGSNANLKVATSVLREFVAFTNGQALTVTIVGAVPNQNIHTEPQPEMVIVTHPNFLSQAEELAQIHMDNSGLRCLVVTNQQVYNEFSSGSPDVTAIRNMMRMFYIRASSESEMPKYLLLFGDGSYDNKSERAENSNYVLTYQSENSLHVTSSFVSDDYFGLLDDNEGEATGLLDIGIGRIPCSTEAEADITVSKIRQYLSPSSYGAWNNQLCFIGDDGDGNLHMRDADLHAQYIEENHPEYNIEKIYFDAFPLVSSSLGDRYPGVTDAINSRANQGALIMNYVGHANARWLAHERVLMINDIQSWRNFDKLSVFVTATCEFSRFDDYNYKSAGEHTLFSPKGGSVALVSTSRVVYANPNYTLNRNFIRYVFAEREGYIPGEPNRFYTLGDVVRLSKVATGGQINKRNFLLLGDPALMLHNPSKAMEITQVNGISVDSELDTIKALSKVTVSGIVSSSKSLEEFMGEAEFTLYDKAKAITTMANTGGIPFTFTSRQNSIYKGRSTVSDGKFNATFIVPKDIMYNYGSGRFSLFASNGSETAAGIFEDFVVGGISDDVGTDTQGPDIEIYMNNTKFVSGGITDPNPKLIVHLTDSSGINTTGVGIGHDLTATVVGEEETSYRLNDYYVAEKDSYQKGRVEYQLSGLNPREYSARVKAWDVYNNSSESEIRFTVRTDDELKVSRVLNYPNPFTQSTGFYFEHNQPFEDFDVSIQIFSPSGKLVKTLEYYFPGDGSYRIGPIHWDGFDDFGDRIGRGVYFYRLRVRLGSGQTATEYQKLVILK
jgi:hypothetical protein